MISPPNAADIEEYSDEQRRAMDDSCEADFLAASALSFASDEPAWTDRYVTALSRLDPLLAPMRAAACARRAWRSHGWAHPAVVAYLEHASGPLDAG